MKFYLLITLVCFVFTFSEAQNPVASLPTCAQDCILTKVAASPCSITDTSCLCTNKTLTAQVEDCVLAQCTVRQALVTQNTTATICQLPIRDRSSIVPTVSVILNTLAVFAVSLRLITRLPPLSTQVGIDDAVISFTALLSIPSVYMMFYLARHGLGKDVWTLTPAEIDKLLKHFYISELIYLVVTYTTKIAIVLFYIRIFSVHSFKRVAYVNLFLVTILGASVTIASIFQCNPVSHAWTAWDHERKGTCIDTNALAWVSAVGNIVFDSIFLVLPIPQLWKLSLSVKKKIQISMMFSVGILVTIISVVRLHALPEFNRSRNPTWDLVPITYWSSLEMGLGVVCACMPAIRILLRLFVPKWFETTRKDPASLPLSNHRQPQPTSDSINKSATHSATPSGTTSQEEKDSRITVTTTRTYVNYLSDAGSSVNQSMRGHNAMTFWHPDHDF